MPPLLDLLLKLKLSRFDVLLYFKNECRYTYYDKLKFNLEEVKCML